MKRIRAISALGTTAMACLLVGCLSISSPTQVPGASQTASPTQAPTATPTAVPITPPPTATPTLALTAAPTLAPTPTVAPTGTLLPAQGDLLFLDDMEDPASGWGTGDTGTSRVNYEAGLLVLEVDTEDAAIWSRRGLDEEYRVVLVAAGFTLTNPGSFGLMCLGPDFIHYGAIVTTRGGLIFFSIENNEVTVLERHADLELTVPLATQLGFGLECFGTETGPLRLVPVMTGTGPLPFYEQDEGPATFNRVGIYGEAFEDGFSVEVDSASAYAISDEGVTPEGDELLTHIPSDWQESCLEIPVTENALAIVQCFLFDVEQGVGPELAQYVLYSTAAEMDAKYQEVVADFGVESTGNCESGPNETTWNIGEETFGRLQCAPQQAGIRFDWSDNRLNIVSTLVDFDENYNTTHDVWVDAGPNP